MQRVITCGSFGTLRCIRFSLFHSIKTYFFLLIIFCYYFVVSPYIISLRVAIGQGRLTSFGLRAEIG